jgi:hypothetical protein
MESNRRRDHGSTRAAALVGEKREYITMNITFAMLSIIMHMYAIQ